MILSLARHKPIAVFSQKLQNLCLRFLFHCGNGSSFWAFYLFVRQPCGAGMDTFPLLYSPILFYRIDIREDANVHKNDLVQVPFMKYLHGCERIAPWLLLPWILLSSTHFDLVSLMAQKVWRLAVSVFVNDRYSHAGNCTSLPSNVGLFLSTCNIYLFLLQRHSFPFDSWPLPLFRFSSILRQNFAI